MTIDPRFSTQDATGTTDSHGYIVDDGYINRFYEMQSPMRLVHSMRCAGYDISMGTAFSYCDLGCGYGLNVIILAACYPQARFVGIDINPEHIAWANQMAERHGLSNATFLCADFTNPDEIDGEFDIIAAHGIYTWVSGDVQQALWQFAGKHLSPCGLFYMSYNSYPGWSAREPLRDMFFQYSEALDGSSVERTQHTQQFMRMLKDSKAHIVKDNPEFVNQLNYFLKEDLRYVAHECCNRNFEPIYASRAFEEAASVGLHYAAQSDTECNFPAWTEPAFVNQMLATIKKPEDREAWLSVLRNDTFRTDIYTRSAPPRFEPGQSPLWEMTLALVTPLQDIPEMIKGAPLPLKRSAPVVQALIEVAQSPGKPLAEIASEHPDLAMIAPQDLLEAAQLLDMAEILCFVPAGDYAPALEAGADWRLANGLFGTILVDALTTKNEIYLPLPRYGTSLRLDQKNALALLAMHEPEPAKALAQKFNASPELIRGPVSERWAEGFLRSYKAKWGTILSAAGTVVAKPKAG